MWKWLTILMLLSPKTGINTQAPSAPGDPIVSCAPPSLTMILPGADGRYAPVFPGWGHYHYPISTTDDSAQYYFDQGLSLYYSYHLTESAASFKEAELRDSRCAMAWWGEALALGPYYNNAYYYKMPPGVLPVLEKMNELAKTVTPKEKDLISALDRRYSTDTSDRRRIQLNSAYSKAMKALIPKYPNDNDIKALFIDGEMTEHAWGMWENNGKPRPWTLELVRDCEDILKSDPNHPAALHYHIHLLEASLHPEATLSSAERLKDLMPGVPHMVHMASHSFQRTGLYEKGVTINDSANAAQLIYSALAPQLHLATFVTHYHAVEAFCALTGGLFGKAMKSARECSADVASRPGMPRLYLQYLSMMPTFVLVRMGKWQDILDRPVPDIRWTYARLISDFARGMAYVRTDNITAARACLDSLREKLKDPSLKERVLPFNAPITGANTAAAILEGEIFFAAGQPKDAMSAFRRAITSEDELSYSEPKDWPLPARHFAGACLLKLGKAAEAAQLYREDLTQNPGNGWSLLGLAQALTAQHDDSVAAEYLARAKTAFAQAEQTPPASVY